MMRHAPTVPPPHAPALPRGKAPRPAIALALAAALAVATALVLATPLLGAATAKPAGASAPSAADAERSAQVDALFSSWVKPDAPGAAVLVLRDGRAVHRKGYGLANLATREPIGPGTVFDLASVSKQFTAMAILILAERGRLRYDDPLTKFFPEFPPYARRVTVRHLLNHTSGIVDYEGLFQQEGKIDTEYPREAPRPGREYEPTSRDTVAILAKQERLRFEPGGAWEYSNSGYVLLGQIAARASGVPLPRFLREEIFKQLGMSATLIYDETKPAIQHRATSYHAADGRFQPIDYTPLNLIYGDGNVNTTIDDMGKWYAALDRHPPVRPTTLRQAFTPGTLNSGERTGYGFGWSVANTFGLERVSHTGSWVGFRALVVFYPSQHLAFIVLSNRDDFDGEARSALAWRLSRVYLGDRLPLPTPIALKEESLRRYEGRYQVAPGKRLTISLDAGALWLRGEGIGTMPADGGEGTLRLVPEAEDRFYPEGLEADRLVFDRDGDLVSGFTRQSFLWGYGRGAFSTACKVR
jgi:CubicO group peptidase (beta-lactamase class C family)